MKKEVALLVIVVIALAFGYYMVKGRGKISPSINTSTSTNAELTSVPAQNSSAAAGSVEKVAEAAPSQIALTITSPSDGSTTTHSTIVLTGKTAAKADVFANGQVGRADANGNFSFELTLDPGQNEILVDANDANGNAAEKDITVTYSGQ